MSAESSAGSTLAVTLAMSHICPGLQCKDLHHREENAVFSVSFLYRHLEPSLRGSARLVSVHRLLRLNLTCTCLVRTVINVDGDRPVKSTFYQHGRVSCSSCKSFFMCSPLSLPHDLLQFARLLSPPKRISSRLTHSVGARLAASQSSEPHCEVSSSLSFHYTLK